MFQRHISKHLLKSMRYYPAITLTGPRQSGKTTVVKESFPDFDYVLLEDPDTLQFANDDPRGFLDQYSSHVIFDEIQNCPQLFSYLQAKIDSSEENGRFVLSGSQQFALNEKITQSLAGRTAMMCLLPLSLSELQGYPSQSYWATGVLREELLPPEQGLHATLFRGMYPRLYRHQIPPTQYYRDYVQTYVTRDLRQLINVVDLNKFMTLLRLVAGCCSQRVNLESLGDDAGVDHTTVKRWLSILQASYIIELVQPHYQNFNKRLIKAPKIHFNDTGLLCYLLGIQKPEDLQSHHLIGGIFESFVFSEIKKTFLHSNLEAPVYYWQDQSKKEIDVIIDRGQLQFPVEIKSGKTISRDYFKHLQYWLGLEKNPQESGCLVYGGNQRQLRNNIQILPWHDVS